MEASALVVSDADVSEPGRMRVAGQRSQPGLVEVRRWRSVRSGHVSRKDGTKRQQWAPPEQITWARKLKCFPQSIVSHGLGVAAKRKQRGSSPGGAQT